MIDNYVTSLYKIDLILDYLIDLHYPNWWRSTEIMHTLSRR